MQRQKLFAGNWKMYKGVEDIAPFLEKFLGLFSSRRGDTTAKYVVLTQAALLPILKNAWQKEFAARAQSLGVDLAWGAQNIHWEKEGAFTGELSPLLAHELDSRYVLAGHSERRQFFGESNADAAKRALAAHQHKMQAIFCVGENLAEREKGQIFEVLARQCEPLIAGTATMPPGFVVAYEPVWAIGTGKTATAVQAEEVHAYLRKHFARAWGDVDAAKLQILYGGSVKPQNSTELMACSNIDGLLIGGASLDPTSFFEIAVNAIQC